MSQELFTGKRPFFHLTQDLQVTLAIVNGQIPSPPQSLEAMDDRLLWGICQLCWDPSPSGRPCMQLILNGLTRGSFELLHPNTATLESIMDRVEDCNVWPNHSRVLVEERQIDVTQDIWILIFEDTIIRCHRSGERLVDFRLVSCNC